MVIDGITICDVCYGAIFPDDLAPVKAQKDGHTHQFHLHNRNNHDCVDVFLSMLARPDAAPCN